MTFWELFGVVLSSAGVFAAILWAFVTYAARKNEEATRALIRAMDERADERRRAALRAFEEMDQRSENLGRLADERHRESLKRSAP